MDKVKYLEYLESYLTPRRKNLIHKVSQNRTRHFTIVAEDTYLDHNASALVRTCDCFGILDLHIIEEIHRYRLAKRMAQGSQKWINIHYYSNYENNAQTCIDELKKQGYAIIGTTPNEHDYLLDDFDVRQKSAFFFGKERTGLSKAIIDQADGLLKIPMYGFTQSFNVSVSAALLLQSVTAKLYARNDIDWPLTNEEVIDVKIDWCLKTIQNGKKISAKYLKEESKPTKS